MNANTKNALIKWILKTADSVVTARVRSATTADHDNAICQEYVDETTRLVEQIQKDETLT